MCENITGEALAKELVEKVEQVCLNMEECRSQSYDGAGTMAGAKSGCAARIRKVYPKAHYYYSMNHDLNLTVSKSCKLPEMQVMLDTVKQFGFFFRYSPKKQHCLEKVVDVVNQKCKTEADVGGRETHFINMKKVNILCDTILVERHVALHDLVIMFEPITE